MTQAGTVDALIKAGADVDLKKDDGPTPLAFAVCEGTCKATLALLRRGVKVDVRNDVCSSRRDATFHLACVIRSERLAETANLLLRWGADETALSITGESPAELLNVHPPKITNRTTRDEIRHTRRLLSRAPADRAWRRRGWLAMLRSRAEEARGGGSCGSGSRRKGDGSGVADGRRKDEGGKTTSGDQTGRGAGHVARRKTRAPVLRRVWATAAAESSVVGLLVGLEAEGVLRTIVGYV